MILYLLRHAEAEPHRPDDFSRALTESGRAQADRVGVFLSGHDIRPELILTSPVRRAKETALIVSRILGIEDPQLMPWLSCGMHPESALAELAGYSELNSLMIVGHEPDFSSLAALLLGLRKSDAINIAKASVAAIDVRRVVPGSGVLKFLLPVKLL
jgi:phosphohistidine phosphatase